MSIELGGGLSTKKLRYVIRGQRVKVVGSVRPFVRGQVVTVMVVRKGKVTVRKRARVRRARRGRGRFVVRFVARRRGLLRVVAVHRATAAQAAFRARSKRVRAVLWSAGGGRTGLRVLLLQRGLRSLGYAVPVTGVFDGGTARAVTAFRKVQGWGRTGYASGAVYGKVFRRQGRFKLRHPRAGRHVEFDWSRQVLVLANRGRAWRTYHASSGKASTPTVFGTLPLLQQDARHQRQGHGPLQLLHRRLRDSRLPVRADLSRQPRLHPHPDPERARRLQLDPARDADLRLPLERIHRPPAAIATQWKSLAMCLVIGSRRVLLERSARAPARGAARARARDRRGDPHERAQGPVLRGRQAGDPAALRLPGAGRAGGRRGRGRARQRRWRADHGRRSGGLRGPGGRSRRQGLLRQEGAQGATASSAGSRAPSYSRASAAS